MTANRMNIAESVVMRWTTSKELDARIGISIQIAPLPAAIMAACLSD